MTRSAGVYVTGQSAEPFLLMGTDAYVGDFLWGQRILCWPPFGSDMLLPTT